MFFHIFGHIDTHHGRIVIEKKSRQSLCQLGLAHAGWPQEHEGPYRPVWILQARPGAANRVTDRGDVRLGYLFLQHMVAFAGFGFGHARFQPGNNAVHKHAGPREVTLALDAFEFAPRLIEFFLDLVRALDLALFRLPDGGKIGFLLLQFGKIRLELFQPVLGRLVGFLAQRLALDFQPNDPPVELIDRFQFGIDLRVQLGCGFIDQMDRLIGHEPVRDIAVRQGRGGDDRTVGNPHAMMDFVFFLEATQDGNCVFERRFRDENRLKPAGKRRVRFNMLAVFVQGGRADAMQLTARERRLQHVRGIHSPPVSD